MDLISATKSHIKEVSVRFYKSAVEKALKSCFVFFYIDIDLWLLQFFQWCSWWSRLFGVGWFALSYTRPACCHPTMACSDQTTMKLASWLAGPWGFALMMCIDAIHWKLLLCVNLVRCIVFQCPLVTYLDHKRIFICIHNLIWKLYTDHA